MEFERHYNSIEEVLEVAKSAEGKLVKEFDVNNRLESKKNKGGKLLKKVFFRELLIVVLKQILRI